MSSSARNKSCPTRGQKPKALPRNLSKLIIPSAESTAAVSFISPASTAWTVVLTSYKSTSKVIHIYTSYTTNLLQLVRHLAHPAERQYVAVALGIVVLLEVQVHVPSSSPASSTLRLCPRRPRHPRRSPIKAPPAYIRIYIYARPSTAAALPRTLCPFLPYSLFTPRGYYIYTQGLLIFFRIPHRTLFHPPCGIDSPLSKDRGARESAACSCTRYIGIIIHTDTNARARAIDRLRSEPAPRARE